MTSPLPRSRRAAVAGTSALVALVLTLLSAPAHAETTPAPTPTAAPVAPTSEPAPAPTPAASPDAPASETPATDPPATDDVPEPEEPVHSAMVARSAVPSAATLFSLQYAFEPGVQPRNVALTVDDAPGDAAAQQRYDWSDGGVHYLQWDFPLPTDAPRTVRLRAELIDTGRATDYAVEFTSTAQRVAGSVAVRTECAILLDGAPVDLAEDSPFGCQGGSGQTASGALLVGAQVSLASWADITGTIDVRNTDATGPRISLRDGVFTTANQDRRIIMNGTEWYPFADTGASADAARFATIDNGGSLTWSASTLNAPRKQSEPDMHAQASFVYEIVLDGAPTGYWVKGSAENYHSGALWYPTATCEIHMGNPEGTSGSALVTRPTPFTCETTGMTKPNVRAAADTIFQVRMAPTDTLRSPGDAKARGVLEACQGDDSDPCVPTIGTVQRVTLDPAVPTTKDSGQSASFTNAAGHTSQYTFDFSFHRGVTHSLDQKLGLELKTEILPGLESTMTSETSYGYDIEKGFEVSQSAEEEVPFWSTGAFYYTDVYDRFTSDLYFDGEGGTWYRVTGATIDVPVAQRQPADADKDDPTISGLAYRCTWMPDQAEKVLSSIITEYNREHQVQPGDRTVEAYADELFACGIPASWERLTEESFGRDPELKAAILQAVFADPDARVDAHQ